MQRFECYLRSGDCSCLFFWTRGGDDITKVVWGKAMCYLIEKMSLQVLVSSALQSVILFLKLLVYLQILNLYALKTSVDVSDVKA